MSKSKYSDSNLYMTTREFADLVIKALDDQKYFREDEVSHPQDIAYAFSTIGESIAMGLSWAIKNEKGTPLSNEKFGNMQSGNLQKTFTQNSGAGTGTESNSYSEWKINKEKGYL